VKPKVRPRKGYRFRIIVCDDEGNVAYDDYTHWPGPIALKVLARELEKHKMLKQLTKK